MWHKRPLIPGGLLILAVVLVSCGPATQAPAATPLGLPPDVAEAAKQRLSEEVDVPVQGIEIVRANQVDWTDTCLDLGGPDEFCGQAITPGWRVILRAEGEEYEIHTDLGADSVRLKEGPVAEKK